MADKALVDRLVDESDHVNSEWWYVPHELLSAVEVSMRASDRRIEALTKALRELVEAGDEIEANAMDESSQAYIDARMRYFAAFHACKALAGAAGAEGEA